MSTFRPRPAWVGAKARGETTPPAARLEPSKPRTPRVENNPFGIGRPWTPSTAWEVETGRQQNPFESCGTRRGGLPCGRPRQHGQPVCGECAADIARQTFTDNARFRAWCAQRLTDDELADGRTASEVAEQERRKQRAAEREHDAVHIVYYVRFAPNHVKIGTSGFLRQRMTALRVLDPARQLLAVEPGGRDVEKQRHEQFKAWKWKPGRRNEDFSEPPELLIHVADVRLEHGDPQRFLNPDEVA